MGWMHTQGASKSDIVAELTAENDHRKTVKASLRGNVLYQVVEIKNTGARFIEINLLRGDRRFGWGSKDLDETCGPCSYDCPLGFLDLADPPMNDTAARWRESVRAYHARQRGIRARARKLAAELPAGSDVDVTGNVTVRGVPVTKGRIAWWKGRNAILHTPIGLVRISADRIIGTNEKGVI